MATVFGPREKLVGILSGCKCPVTLSAPVIFFIAPFASSVALCKCILINLFGSCKGLIRSSENILPLMLKISDLLSVGDTLARQH